MKKITALLMALCLLLALSACGNTGSGASAGTNAGANNAGQDKVITATQAVVEDSFTFTYKGVDIRMHAPAAPIIAALGEPKTYTEQASCAFQGLDKTYYYGSFYMDTYPVGDQDYVYGWWFVDDTVTTEEGIYIGAAQAEVEKAYGADAYNGSNAYIITDEVGTLTVILEEGKVSSIQYNINLQESPTSQNRPLHHAKGGSFLGNSKNSM